MGDPGAEAPPASTEADLARRVARNERSAEVELCRRFAPRIRLYGIKHLRTEDRARDLVQSVLLIAIEALRSGKVEDPDRIDRFVLGTCRHVAQRVRHMERVTKPADVADLELAIEPNTDALDFPSLLRCLSRLDTRLQLVMQLSFYRDRSADEIAGILETTAGNVRVMRHRAVAQLRDCLEGPRGEP